MKIKNIAGSVNLKINNFLKLFIPIVLFLVVILVISSYIKALIYYEGTFLWWKIYNGKNYLVKFDVKPNGLEYVKYGEEENIGKKGWVPVEYLTDEKVEEYMKGAANYGEYKYELDNAPRIR